ncbi:MAG: hypothetical protein U9P00_14740 [Pseudomonadota bacterium]|nr:hypothetical protein [Pseudomonadota bacterium]
MYRYENPRYSANRSFTDFMFILICGLTLIFVLTLMQIIKNNEGVVHKAEFVLTLVWDKKDKNDLDLWLKNPLGEIIYYRDTKVPSMFIDRDDRGYINDIIMINGIQKIIYINQEIVSIRALIPGKWTVAVHFFKRYDKKTPGTPIPITVRLDKINPKIKIIFNEERIMKFTWEEMTIATFEILEDGTVTNINLAADEPMVHERLVQMWHPDADGDGNPEEGELTEGGT